MEENVVLILLIIVGILVVPYYVSHTGPSERDTLRDAIQEEIWELEKKQDASWTSYCPSRQARINYLKDLLDKL